MKRLSLAFRCFFSLLFTGKISEKILAELRTRVKQPAAEEAGATTQESTSARKPVVAQELGAVPKKPATAEERAVQILALLQRDARLVDFFEEDIQAYDDAQVGAAVRDLHASCKTTLNRYVALEPILQSEEGTPVTVEPGFEPGTIKLIGNVTGKLPARGVLRHHGWRAGKVQLPELPDGAARTVVAPAEVEIS